MTNGGPLLVRVFGGAESSKAAGVVFAATMLVRIPAYLFQGLAASLLPNFTHLQASEDTGRFSRAVTRAAFVLFCVGVLLTVVTAVGGPRAMTVFGAGFRADRTDLVLLASGVAFYLTASTFSQALLSVDRGVLACCPWVLSGILFILGYAGAVGAPLHRISIAFVLAAATNLVGLSLAFAFAVTRRRGARAVRGNHGTVPAANVGPARSE
jgi:O-antigen/teichoic acid export membrane protein